MDIIKTTTFSEVLAFFDSEHPVMDPASPAFSGNYWGRGILGEANRDFDGKWTYVALDPDDARGIVLPHHRGEDGKIVLVGEKGSTVKQVVEVIQHTPDYADQNPVCWQKMSYWRDRPFSPLFLSVAPAGAKRRKLIDPSMGTLFHLDGLHRLVIWGLMGRLDRKNYSQNGKITAYLAG